MIYLVFIASVFLYLWSRNRRSLGLFPSDLVFWRDYVGLTLVGLLYYSDQNKFRSHYIFGSLPFSTLFWASFLAFSFMAIALLTKKICFPYLLYYLNKRSSHARPYLSETKKFMIVLLTFVTFIVSFYFFYSNRSDLFLVLSASLTGVEVASLRYDVSSNSFVKYVLKSLAPLMLFLNLVFLGQSYSNRLKKSIICFSVLLSLASAFIGSVYFFEKSSSISLILIPLAALLYDNKVIKVSIRLVLAILSLGVLLVYVGYSLTYRIIDTSHFLDLFQHRFTSQVSGLIASTAYFSKNEPLGWSSISSIFADRSSDVALSPYFFLMQKYSDSQYGRALSSFAAGDSYAAFGISGIFFGGIILGLHMAIMDIFCLLPWSFLKFIYSPVFVLVFSLPVIASSFYSFFFPVGFVLASIPLVCIAMFDDLTLKETR